MSAHRRTHTVDGWTLLATWGWMGVTVIATFIGAVISNHDEITLLISVYIGLFLAVILHGVSDLRLRYRQPRIEYVLHVKTDPDKYPPPYRCVDRQFVDGVANRWCDAP